MFSFFSILSLFVSFSWFFFFFNVTATTEIYTFPYTTLFRSSVAATGGTAWRSVPSASASRQPQGRDRKSTRLNSSHLGISYAVFCLKKKKDSCIASYFAQKKKDRRTI